MHKGKWNYSEDIEFRVIWVRLHAVPDPPLHWQNALEGEERQAVECHYKRKDGTVDTWVMDNGDGSGLFKGRSFTRGLSV